MRNISGIRVFNKVFREILLEERVRLVKSLALS
jgi:hypothetical protein